VNVFADLHIHIGRSGDGRPVKITAADSLTVENLLFEAAVRKGIGMVGIVDSASPGVQRDLQILLERGLLQMLAGGGLRYAEKVTLILGVEVETGEAKGSGHFVAYFPSLEAVKEFSAVLNPYITNMQLSTQKARLNLERLWDLVSLQAGILVPAHVFTPYKSLYGSCCDSLTELLRPEQVSGLKAVELGLSSDTELAQQIRELNQLVFLSNSDAHSLPKIGREYNLLRLNQADFRNLVWALEGKNGCSVAANFGFDPKLGKYHRTFCNACLTVAQTPPPVETCPACGSGNVVMGVLDRITQLAQPCSSDRPPYIHQIPLQFLPGLGPKTLERLLREFGTEMNVLHHAQKEDLQEVVGPGITRLILASRDGTLEISPGGGGVFGRVLSE